MRPEGPPARRRPKPAATFDPSGQVPRATSHGCLGFLMIAPFVGLWGVPSLPTRTASWPSQPYAQVRPVRLTAFPGGSIRFPDSAAPTARSKAYPTDRQIRVKAPKPLVGSHSRRSEATTPRRIRSDKSAPRNVRAGQEPRDDVCAAANSSRFTLITTRSTHRPSFHDRSRRRPSRTNPHASYTCIAFSLSPSDHSSTCHRS